MQIVIDIDDESYEHIKSYKNEDVLPMGWYAIGHGTPLTKVDCISRQAVLEQTYNWSKDEFLRVTNPFHYLRKRIDSLPPVIPQPKTGHWIANAPQYDMLNPQYICSECGNAHIRTTPYCEMCGAKMIEPQESEE